MAKIHNPTIRPYHLPSWPKDAKPGDPRIRPGTILNPGETIDIPDEAFRALLSDKNHRGEPTGWANRLDVDENKKTAHVRQPTGVAGDFARRVRAQRAQRSEETAESRASADTRTASDTESSRSSSSRKSSSSKSEG